MDIKELYQKDYIEKEVTVQGWIRNHRKQSHYGFIDLSDGTCFKHLQIVYDDSLPNFEEIAKLKIGSAITATGILKKSPKDNQNFELTLEKFKLEGDCPDEYPIQPKRHTREFLREQAYLRPRTNLFQAVFRIRSMTAFAIHKYFQDNGYVYVTTPIITCADCEGSGEMFNITKFDLDKLPKDKDGKVDFKEDLFGKPAFVTGTGQLHGETFAMAYKKIYTFGPTFRTEESNTKTHANEFWMIEPEIAFYDLEDLMNMEEDMLKYIVKYILDNCKDEIDFLNNFVEKGLKEKLTKLINSKFVKITHKEAVDLLMSANVKWEFTPDYESDIAKEHEKYITEYYNSPVFITNWPKDIKSFYMKQNDDGKTVAAVDLEVPGVGELMGGSQREDDYEKLITRMKELNMSKTTMEELYWYLNLRRYGGCYHSGFGLGFERLLMYLTGIENIRDVIPYPRTPNSCNF